ncbi:nucleotidyltransferase family protein [Thalassovita sp.]|uniref:nucleotidyltransferase family protein n=1 Tax=Thalassovita sp. TaxID=1979401 RepID=UPI0029DE5A8C|nr:nucleotidyltransferase family protein [Thalassovita sp.]
MSGPADHPPALSFCHSAPHRAVLGLLAIALGRTAYPGLEDDLRNSQPEQIAAIANQGYAQVILYGAFKAMPHLQVLIPQDLLIYFSEMRRANTARNARAIQQMTEIGNLLDAQGIPTLALKGAADVLDPLHTDPAFRYISDLDLLVPQDRISDAARCLRRAKGMTTEAAEIQPGPHHHIAQIAHADWPLTIELHLRPGSAAVCSVLDPAAMFACAGQSCTKGIALPSRTDRALHNVLHGMELRHETYALNLRNLADHIAHLERLSEDECTQALNRMTQAGKAAWLTDLTALVGAIKGTTPAAGGWAARSLASFGEPEAARSRDTAFWIRRYAKRAFLEPTYRRQLIHKVFSVTAWRAFIQFHRERNGRFK